MNLILFLNDDLSKDGSLAEISGLRAKHIIEVHKAEIGKELTAGLLNGNIGKCKVNKIGTNYVNFELGNFNTPPPPALPLTLIISLPRPKTLKKVVHIASCMGVKKIYFIESWKVDKSYWKSPVLNNNELTEQCILGLEQAKDTVLPEILFRRRFKPFAEDELNQIITGTTPLAAHPYKALPCPERINSPVTLAVGPEGGFTDYEVKTFKELGFSVITLGERILRVEYAVCSLLSKIFK
ncbi:MAG TPA: 16S rRNA (uracil(1498)-N(3))-methyltransferase [Lentisphaeria bacterium]|nr:MAG: 16S rRNA (uracil(1498)-N(3))-methyltransferase [Lentisphaerae bacterium GWF2_38_69]HBM15886.1 16S rRNA (uracil(1498)-N(3))-methyltransferase [Lentisphaeria bacterium]